ncbi:tRNA pseudouridine(55) synthase TruB [Tardibacter chloracetimidivorans]|uniref:tRNA pseudouridine synthase B n=1 Tax=Tardibacter chloracetimidivorans TaxID=1921510 RepID=A0A1L3ZTT8_9SPHN|nr:tRNA pseudouridine(55) synthase TruB [Tardibacter chloracetimidivorans]API59056.1 tRNA pseudouridine(55) synthase TruB [Tardibacter chloracetimidivorans]
MNGWIILDKPIGISSSQAVGAVKRILRQNDYGRLKLGHGGTLDPLATGVLPIALGEATKLTGRLLNGDKSYDFTIGFGAETDTLDAEGRIVAASDVRPTLADVEAVLPRFTGPIEQMPPAFSALKVDGRRAYDLARAGESVALEARTISIYDLSVRPERTGRLDAITLSVRCSKGTYVRSLARDIAHALGAVGHVTMLRRTGAGPFTLEGAIPLDRLEEIGQGRALEQILLPMMAGLDDIPALALSPDQAGRLRKGQQLVGIAANHGLHVATDGSVPVALVEVSGHGVRVVRGFNL